MEPERLEWSLNDDLVEKINEAKQKNDGYEHINRLCSAYHQHLVINEKYNRAINDFEMTVFKYDKFGRAYPKLLNMSPDSFLQVIYQFAYFR